jgi:hypothetical protein
MFLPARGVVCVKVRPASRKIQKNYGRRTSAVLLGVKAEAVAEGAVAGIELGIVR